jgi:Family of unknown function (DUF6289)
VNKKKALWVSLTIVAAALFGAAEAKAPPIGYESFIYYYSDQAHTNVVGGQHWTCGGDLDIWGQHGYSSGVILLPCSP